MSAAPDDRWILIPNWGDFQSYEAARPAWIKLATDLNSNDKWVDAPCAVRGLLVTIWAEYARSACQLRVRSVLQLCGKSARSSHITALVNAGFIELSSSKPASLRARARVRSPEEKEREEETLHLERLSSSNGSVTSSTSPPAAKAAATKGGSNLTQNADVADAALAPYRHAFRWVRDGDNYRRTDWRHFVETEYGVTDDVDLAALEQEHDRLEQEASA